MYFTNPHEKDTDNDKIPDKWEVERGLDPLIDDSQQDPDGDGIVNLGEYLLNRNPFVWDNWILLYSGYLLPVWVILIATAVILYIYMKKAITRKNMARAKEFHTYEDMIEAESLGFSYGSVFYFAQQAGFSTREQLVNGLDSGFLQMDEWIEANLAGFETIDSKIDVESIGFSDFSTFFETVTRDLRRFRHRLHQLVVISIEIEEETKFTKKRIAKYQKNIRQTVNDIQILKASLENYSTVSTRDYELNKTINSEIEESDKLIKMSKRLLKDLEKKEKG
jgi:hypothetical protein